MKYALLALGLMVAGGANAAITPTSCTQIVSYQVSLHDFSTPGAPCGQTMSFTSGESLRTDLNVNVLQASSGTGIETINLVASYSMSGDYGPFDRLPLYTFYQYASFGFTVDQPYMFTLTDPNGFYSTQGLSTGNLLLPGTAYSFIMNGNTNLDIRPHSGSVTATLTAIAVPEPMTLGLLGGGLVVFVMGRRRRA